MSRPPLVLVRGPARPRPDELCYPCEGLPYATG